MIATRVDISQLDRHELRALRDEIDFEIQLHDAELRAFYDGRLSEPTDEPTDDFWCPICEEREGQVEDLESDVSSLEEAVRDALAILIDGSKPAAQRIEEAASALDDMP